MKRNEKGFTLVEVIVTFCLISTISFLLFQIILSLKNLYTSSDYKTVLLIDQGNLTRRINDDFFNLTLREMKTCNTSAKLCLDFTMLDNSLKDENGNPKTETKRLEVIDASTDTERKIVYDGYATTLTKGSSFGDISATVSYITDDSVKYNTFLTIDVPVTNKLSEGDFGLHFTAQFYTEMDATGEKPIFDYNTLVKDKGLTAPVNQIKLTTFTVNDFIRRVLPKSEDGKYTKDGLYNISTEDWHSTDKDFPKYVYKGTNPNNFVAMGTQCYRILQITNETGLKLVYDGTYANNTCTTATSAPKTSAYGTDNNWLTSPIRNTVLKEFIINPNSSINSNFFYGSMKRPATTTEDTMQNLVTQTMKEKGSSAIPSAENSYYGDHGVSIAIPTILDYILASRDANCTNMTQATNDVCGNTNYLNKNYSYWLMTADGNSTTNEWSISGGNVMTGDSSWSLGVLPVIYLKSSTVFTVSENNTNERGSKANPYIAST